MLLVLAMDGCVVVVLVAGGDATMVRHMATDGATMATDRPVFRPDPHRVGVRLMLLCHYTELNFRYAIPG